MTTRRMLYLQFNNPGAYPPLMHSARILADAGWQVRLLGVGTSFTEGFKTTAHPRIETRLLPNAAGGWRLKFWYLHYGLRAFLTVALWRPRWIYVSDPLAAPFGCVLWLLGWRRLIYHEHDAPAAEGQNGFMRFVLRCRLRLARQAEIVVAPNRTRAELLREASGREHPVFCVWNCPHSSELAPLGSDMVGEDDFVVVYHGSINADRVPMPLIAALRHTPEAVKLHIIGYETVAGAVAQILAAAAAWGLGERVRYLGAFATREEILQIARGCQLGVALFPQDPDSDINLRLMAGASNKIFDYLACGLPVLTSRSPDWIALIEAHGLGFTCDPGDELALAAVLRQASEQRDALRAMGEAGRRKILGEWHYERCFAPVLAALEGPP